MIHPHTEIRFINEKIGYGVVATRLIPKGTITWAIDKFDRIFTHHQIKSMDPVYQQIMDTYAYRNQDGNYILCWDNARFVNHSSNSNCITTAYEFEIAIRDIHPGEELTDDYGYLNVDEPFEVVPEIGTDRTIIYPDDILRYYHVWDDKLWEAFQYLKTIPQPLEILLEKGTIEKAGRIANRMDKMDSILHCYCADKNSNEKVYPELQIRSPYVIYPV